MGRRACSIALGIGEFYFKIDIVYSFIYYKCELLVDFLLFVLEGFSYYNLPLAWNYSIFASRSSDFILKLLVEYLLTQRTSK